MAMFFWPNFHFFVIADVFGYHWADAVAVVVMMVVVVVGIMVMVRYLGFFVFKVNVLVFKLDVLGRGGVDDLSHLEQEYELNLVLVKSQLKLIVGENGI